MQDGHETRLDLDEVSLQEERSVSNVPEHSHRSERDHEIENLQKQARKLEVEIRSRCCRKDREGSSGDLDYEVGSMAGLSHWSDSWHSRERSNETMG